jgi:hypothetical protein
MVCIVAALIGSPLLTGGTASASGFGFAGGGGPGDCLTHSLSVTPGSQLEVLTHLENGCGEDLDLVIGYRASGPCRHALAVRLEVPTHPVDVVTFYDWPCAGHYVLRESLGYDGRRAGQDTVEFDAPG